MKKLALCLLVLIMVFSCVSAFAVETNGQGDMVARSGELAAFSDGSGNIYISGLNTPVNTTKADSILSIDPYRVLFFAQGNLINLDLDGFGESIITNDAYAACLSGDEIYFISRTDRTRLMRYDLNTQATDTVFTTNEALERIYASGSGVVVTVVEGAGAYITDAVSGAFVAYEGDAAAEIAVYEDYEIYLTDNHNLYLKQYNAFSATLVDTAVQDWTVMDDTIYYISGSTAAATLKRYDISTAALNTVFALTGNMEMQLTASEHSLFMLSTDNVVYTVDGNTGKLSAFTTLPALDSYTLSAGQSVESYRIEAVSGQLNVYGNIKDSNTLPTFTFVDFSSQVVADASSSVSLLSAYAIDNEDTVWNLLQPAEQYTTLRKGNRGEAVSAIQQPLYELNYYDYYIDGIFGWRTERAIEMLQADLNMEVTGVADAQLQKLILSGTLSAYDPYRSLSRGDRGYRVTEMQQRLRDLGYLADSADGVFGSRTQAAVELFQRENGLDETGVANAATLRALYADSAKSCSSYIDLQRGDSGYRVRELNKRLKELYYLEGSVGSNYNSATVAAVTRFQQEVGLKQTGKATTTVQKELFAKDAPEYSGYITLRRGDENARVKDMQRRLSELGYYTGKLDGYFGKETQVAVRAFQNAAGLEDTGVADPETLKALYSDDAPAYEAPEKIGTPVIELSAYTKLEDGIYYIADSDTIDGGVTVSWSADGDVENYDVSITDDRNVVYTESKNVDLTIASIPLTSLDAERTYTITVTAHPKDTKNDKDTTASICFVRVAADPEPEVGEISSLVVMPEGENISREDNVYILSDEMLSFKWSADGSVSGYVYVISDFEGNQVLTSSEMSDDLGVNIEAVQLSADETYVLTVYAVPTNGSMSDATAESISFRRKAQEATEAPAEPEEQPEEPAEEPAEEPDADVNPVTATIGDPALTIEPSVGSSYMEVPTPEGGTEGADVVYLAEGTISFGWTATGDVSGYNVRITDADGVDMVNQNLANTGATISSDNMTCGMPYCITVTAYAANSDVTTSARAYFLLPYPVETIDTPAVEEPEVEEPAADVLAEEAEEPIAEEPAAEELVADEAASDAAEEPVEEPAEAPEVTEEPTPEPTEEPTPEPTEEPTPEPEPEDNYPMDDPDAWQDTITADSPAEAIHTIQKRLVEWKWLAEGSYSKGELDEATAEAVIAFQNYCNENGKSVEISDAAELAIHKDTLHLLFNADGERYKNPNA